MIATALMRVTIAAFPTRSRTVGGKMDSGALSHSVTPALVVIPLTDTQPPTAPGNLTASASSSAQIDLAWAASTDNVGVTGYDVFSQSMEVRRRIGYLPENVPLYTDMRVAPYLDFVAEIKQRLEALLA